MLSPEQRAEMIQHYKELAEIRRGLGASEENIRLALQHEAVATALTNEAALAEQVRVLREALEHPALKAMLWWVLDHGSDAAQVNVRDFIAAYDAALALSIPEAARQAAENAEKSGLLEWWFDETNEGKREEIRGLRSICEIPWTVEEWIARVRSAKEAGNG
jgi:hypothetical protein